MANKTNNYQIAGDITLTTTGNIDDLDVKGYSLIRMNNASLATIRGIRAGYAGQKITFVSVGAGQVDFAHQNSNSSAANRLINFATSGTTPLAPGKGICTYEYDAETLRWRLSNHSQGDFINVAYSAGNFTAGGAMTWTVELADQQSYAFMLVNTTLILQAQIVTSSIGGTAGAELRLAIPNGYTLATAWTSPGFTVKNSAASTIHESLLQNSGGAGFAYVSLYLLGAVNWPLTTNTTNVYFTAAFPVQ